MDLLIKLYGGGDAAPPCWAAHAGRPTACTVRKPTGPEHGLVVDWVRDRFGPRWASEAGVALANRPVTLWLAAAQGALLGFACYDATARGYFGPIGIDAAQRGSGVGASLLAACLGDMRSAGYGYAVVGAAGSPEFFARVAGAIEIPDSTPGLYADRLKR